MKMQTATATDYLVKQAPEAWRFGDGGTMGQRGTCSGEETMRIDIEHLHTPLKASNRCLRNRPRYTNT